MNRREIKLDSGGILDLDNTSTFVHILGYQIEEITTGRILPMTQRHEIFTMNAAVEKAFEVAESQKISGEYHLLPIYDFEMESGYVIRMSNKDFNEL